MPARQVNPLLLRPFQPPRICLQWRAVSRRVRLAARITHVVHPDRAVESNVVGLDLLGDGVDFEDVYAADGERDEVEAPAPEDLGAEVEDVHSVNAGHGGHIWQTADEFFFGIGCAELWEERKVSNAFVGTGPWR